MGLTLAASDQVKILGSLLSVGFGSISGRPRKNKKAHLNKRDSLFCMAFELAHWVPLPLDSELNINFC